MSKHHFIGFKMWKIGEVSAIECDAVRRRAAQIPGCTQASECYEARDRWHSAASHKGIRVHGAGTKFKAAAEAAGFKIYPA